MADQSETNIKERTGLANAIVALAHGMHEWKDAGPLEMECIHCHVKAPKMSGFAARRDCSKF
jgi:hypothetical protein